MGHIVKVYFILFCISLKLDINKKRYIGQGDFGLLKLEL